MFIKVGLQLVPELYKLEFHKELEGLYPGWRFYLNLLSSLRQNHKALILIWEFYFRFYQKLVYYQA